MIFCCYTSALNFIALAEVVKLVNTRDLKSLGLTALSVQVRPPAPSNALAERLILRKGYLDVVLLSRRWRNLYPRGNHRALPA